MKTGLQRVVALVVMVAIILPSSFILPSVFIEPPRQAHAQWEVFDPLNWIFNGITSAAAPITANSTLLTQIKGFILDPLAHALAQAVLQSITASVVNWINGSNGSGQPSFVQNLAWNLQMLGDVIGLSFIAQFQQSINSPFIGFIASSLRQGYLQQSSLAGFYAANQCTLYQISPNINSFVAGNFSQGGWASWFALTTRPQNDPYMLFVRGQSQLASLINSGVLNRRQDLMQSGGFLSWCGPRQVQATSITTSPGTVTVSLPTLNDDGTSGPATTQTSAQLPAQTLASPTTLAGAGSCVNKDGTTGMIQTPGSVIHDQLVKVAGSGVDSLVNTHDFDQMVNAILAALITRVVSDTGLLGTSRSIGGASPFTSQLNTSNPLNAQGTTGGTVGGSINAQTLTQLQTKITDIQNYQSSWQKIGTAAQSANATLNALISCYQVHGTADTAGASTALSTLVAPVQTQAQAAAVTSAAAMNDAQQAQTAAKGATTLDQASKATGDMARILTSPPSTADVAYAQAMGQVTNSATSTPTGSLNVSSGSLIDQMNLLSKNGQTALNACQGTTGP